MEILAIFYAIYMAMLYILLLVFCVIGYILCGKGMSAIARRRGIEKPWLAWVPVGNMWLLGCISDQYRYLAYGQQTNRRRTLLILSIVTTACSVPLSVMSAMMSAMTQADPTAESVLIMSLVVLVFACVVLAVAVVQSVMQFMAYYDLFRSCDPGKSLMYLLVSLFVTFPLPFFVYGCRDKDLGLPPRTQEEPIVE